MKAIILSEDFDKSFKYTVINYINVKQDSPMIFGHLCIIHYQEFTHSDCSDIITIAAAVELIILSADILDDLQDNDSDYLWCEEPYIAMNIASALIFLAIKLVNGSTFIHKQKALDILNDFALKSIHGQHQDLLNNNRCEKSYLKMISLKSGSLTSLSSLVGTMLALGIHEPRVAEYSNDIGVIQQINNDIMGLKIWNKKNDLLNKKISLPIIYLSENSEELSKILKDYYSGVTAHLDKQVFQDAFINSGAIHYAYALKYTFKYRASHLVETMPFSEDSQKYLKTLME